MPDLGSRTRNDAPVHLWPGDPYPLGVTFDGTGANVAVFAPHAEAVELCLFDDGGEETRVTLPEHHGPGFDRRAAPS